VVFEIERHNVPVIYRQAADTAFRGIPSFPNGIVVNRRQWSLSNRAKCILVIKEVNPLATRWLVEQYRPRIVYLVRHPAAVALSFARLGWSQRPICFEHGEEQGATHRAAWDVLSTYPDRRVIQYEDLCADPIGVFRSLFEFSGLIWDRLSERHVREHSTRYPSDDEFDPMDITRNSFGMIRSWVGKLDESELRSLWAGYSAFDLPWYASASAWR
jgi:hypothetical protein